MFNKQPWFSQSITPSLRVLIVGLALLIGVQINNATAQNSTNSVLVKDLSDLLITTRNTNVRAGPGTGYKVIERVNVGDEVEVSGKVGKWYRIELANGKQGFVFAKLFTAGAPEAVAQPKPKIQVVTTKKNNKTVKTTSNVRMYVVKDYSMFVERIANSEEKGKVKIGQQVEILRTRGHWHLIKTAENKIGYIQDFFLSETDPKILLKAANKLRKKNLGRVTSRHGGSIPINKYKTDLGGKKLGYIAKGQFAEILENIDNRFYKVISSDNIVGYVSGVYAIKEGDYFDDKIYSGYSNDFEYKELSKTDEAEIRNKCLDQGWYENIPKTNKQWKDGLAACRYAQKVGEHFLNLENDVVAAFAISLEENDRPQRAAKELKNLFEKNKSDLAVYTPDGILRSKNGYIYTAIGRYYSVKKLSGDQRNYTKSAYYYKMAVDMRESQGMISLAYRYYKGNGVPQDKARACSLLDASIELGNSLANIFKTTQCFDSDDYEAQLQEFEEAAKAGSHYGYHFAAGIYEIKLNRQEKALEYYRKAAKLGNLKAEQKVKEMTKRLNVDK